MKSFVKLTPVLLLLVVVLSGIDILLAAAIAMFFASFICMLTEKMKLGEILNIAIEGAKNAVPVGFILMMAYAVAEIFMVTGVGASAIELLIGLGVTGKTVAVVSLLTASVLSVSTGTSMGTFAATFPIFIWLCDMVGGSPVLTFAAVCGGSAFGDNIGLISDTTILSSGMQDVKVTDRVRSQLPWSLICLLLAMICFFAAGNIMGLPGTTANPAEALASLPEATLAAIAQERPSVLTLLGQVQTGVPIYMIIPVIVVIILAVCRIDTIVCLASGIFAAIVFGFLSGNVSSLIDMTDSIVGGFASAGSWSVILLFWAMGFGAIMRRLDAFRPLTQIFVSVSRKVRHLITCNGVLCLLTNIVLTDELAQIATVGPVIKDIVEENVEGSEEDIYKLRTRNALLSDAVGVHTAALIPWHVVAVFYMGIANAVYPLHTFAAPDLFYNFMSIICVISIYLLTVTGWDRFIPLFGLPQEPDIHLKKLSKSHRT